MRRITLWVLSTVAGLVLLFSYRTSTMGGATTVAAPAGTGDNTTTDTNTDSGTGTSTNTGSGSGSTSSGSYKGSVAQTRWGPVQVSITVANGRITAVAVPTYPNSNGRDQQINAYALPILKQETLSAQSANIDTVSGATVTSDGYISSLQSALDAAHLS
jgi:uncharacterized protein with FMN-binding domain